MNQIFSYIYDFISLLFEQMGKEKIKRIVLFGSVASGNITKKSDVDLFIEVKNKKQITKVENEIRKTIENFEIIAEDRWYIKGIKLPIKPIVGVLEESKWKALREDIISNGITLFGKFEELPKKLSHYTLVQYTLKKLKQKEKMVLIRKLFGYVTKKNEKIYKQEGMIEKRGGIKLIENLLLIPVEESQKFHTVLSSFKLTPKMREIWLRKE